MEIRNAVASDVLGILEIYNWAVANTTATFDLNPQTLEQRMEWFSHYGENHPLRVITDDKEMVLGYASLSPFRAKDGYARTSEISLYVHPDHHGKGIGKLLIEDILACGRSAGHHIVVAGITRGNDVSVKLHEKFGFVKCGEFPEVGFKFGVWQDCLFYQLCLD